MKRELKGVRNPEIPRPHLQLVKVCTAGGDELALGSKKRELKRNGKYPNRETRD